MKQTPKTFVPFKAQYQQYLLLIPLDSFLLMFDIMSWVPGQQGQLCFVLYSFYLVNYMMKVVRRKIFEFEVLLKTLAGSAMEA